MKEDNIGKIAKLLGVPKAELSKKAAQAIIPSIMHWEIIRLKDTIWEIIGKEFYRNPEKRDKLFKVLMDEFLKTLVNCLSLVFIDNKLDHER